NLQKQIWIALKWFHRQLKIIWDFSCHWFNYCSQKIRIISWTIMVFLWEWMFLPIWNFLELSYNSLYKLIIICFKKLIEIYNLIISIYWDCQNYIIGICWPIYNTIEKSLKNICFNSYQMIIKTYYDSIETINHIYSMISLIYNNMEKSLKNICFNSYQMIIKTYYDSIETINHIYSMISLIYN